MASINPSDDDSDLKPIQASSSSVSFANPRLSLAGPVTGATVTGTRVQAGVLHGVQLTAAATGLSASMESLSHNIYNDSDSDSTPRLSRAYRDAAGETVEVPKIQSFVRLDKSGAFSDMPSHQEILSARSSSVLRSRPNGAMYEAQILEDTVQDRRKRLSYIDITSREKREVFQLAAVRRSMRHLQYGGILMQDDVLALAEKFMEIGPNRASLMYIGHQSLQGSDCCSEKRYIDEVYAVHKYFGIWASVRGYNKFFWVAAIIAGCGEIAFHVIYILRLGMNVISVTSLAMVVVMTIVNAQHCFKAAWDNGKLPLAKDMDLDDLR